MLKEPSIFGLDVSLAFLYFIVYSILGWCMETTYCSVREKRFVPRGFLYGPLCPIYGFGVLMMICWFQPLMKFPVLFYAVATVCMSAWEYFVGWFLEATTHIKYWDYSMYRFNLHGRICLWVCLMWGVLSFLVLYFIHPMIAHWLSRIQTIPRYVLNGVFFGILLSDAFATVYQLVKTSQMLEKLQQAGDELRLQAHLGKVELADRLSQARVEAADRLEEWLPEGLDERGRALKERYDILIARTEHLSRRFRMRYSGMTAVERNRDAFESVKRRGEQLRAHLEHASHFRDE